MGRIKDLTGQKFGRLTVIRDSGLRASNGNVKWECLCECGNICYKIGSSLKSNHVQSCGCYLKDWLKENHIKDVTGQKFGKWTALERTNELGDAGSYKWICQCECGTIKKVDLHSLTSGRSLSCGCLKSKGEEKIAQSLSKLGINFIKEYTGFDDCLNKETNTKLRFDFYLPEYNCCIEYDGIQHFQSGTGWNSKSHLIKTQTNDSIKNQYCTDNKIKLIRISYLDFNKINSSYLMERLGDL